MLRTGAVEALGKDADDAQVDEEGTQQHQRGLQAQEAQHATDAPRRGRAGPPAAESRGKADAGHLVRAGGGLYTDMLGIAGWANRGEGALPSNHQRVDLLRDRGGPAHSGA